MKHESTEAKLVKAFFMVVAFCACLAIAYTATAATPPNKEVQTTSTGSRTCNGKMNCNDIDIDYGGAGGDGGQGGTGGAGGDANANSESNSNSEANSTQNVSIDARSPGRSFIGGGDSTSDDQKVFAIGGGWLTGNAAIRFDITDKEARKLRIAAGWRSEGLIDASNRLQCSLKLVYKPFGSAEECYGALSPKVEPTSKVISEAEYNELTMAQVAQEEFKAVVEQADQQALLIEELEEEHKRDIAQIAALQAIAAKIEDTEEQEAREWAEQQKALAAILEKREAADAQKEKEE
jgi:hypothetical protein